MKFLDWIIARAKEPSTRNGLAIGLTALSSVTPYPYSWMMLGAATMLGGHNMIAKDKLPPVPPELAPPQP